MPASSIIGQWSFEGTCVQGHKKADKICKICDDALLSSGFPVAETVLSIREDGSFDLRRGETVLGGAWEQDEETPEGITLRFREGFTFNCPGTFSPDGEDACQLLFPYSKYEGFLQRTQSIIGKADTFLTIVALQTTVSDGGKVLVGFRLRRIR